MSTATMELPPIWAEDVVPFTDVFGKVSAESGATLDEVRRVFREGLAEPLPKRGRCNAMMLDRETAERLVKAAAYAVVAGVVIAAAFKMITALADQGIDVPLPGSA